MTNRLNALLAESGAPALDLDTSEQFSAYLALLQKWNQRTNLTSIRDEEGILRRHFVESIVCAQRLPENIVSLLDFGSGAGFPGIPITLIRKDLSITLAESQHKKAAFLREAVRILGLSTRVHSGRAETLASRFDCVTLRAVDDMAQAIPTAVGLLAPRGWLALLTTVEDVPRLQALAGQSATFHWDPLHPLAAGTQRVLLLGQTSS